MANVWLRECRIIHATEKAIKIEYELEEVWIPRSAVLDHDGDALAIGETLDIEISDELADEKGLI